MLRLSENYILSKERKEKILEYLPKKQDLIAIERVYSTLAEKTRIRIVSVLSISPTCVTDLCELLEINQTTLSHQLAFLRNAGVVEDERRGKTVVYSIKNKAVLSLFSCALDYIEEDNAKSEDFAVDF